MLLPFQLNIPERIFHEVSLCLVEKLTFCEGTAKIHKRRKIAIFEAVLFKLKLNTFPWVHQPMHQ